MKRIISIILFLLFVAALGACQGMPNLDDLKSRVNNITNKPTYEPINPKNLNPTSQMAIALFDMEKEGVSPSIPFVKVRPDGRMLENNTNYEEFKQRNIIIIDFKEGQDGVYSQRTVSESVDDIGRVDLSDNGIAFRVSDPGEKEAKRIQEAVSEGSKFFKKMPPKLRKDFNKALAEYQRAMGLVPDGIMGKKTSEVIARSIPVFEIQDITSRIFYPPEPRNSLYVVPVEVVDRNPGKFCRGFDSIQEVKRNAVTVEGFAELDKPGQKFVLFVYFFDRITPGDAIKIALSPSERQWSRYMTPKMYADPKAWPVLMESFTIDEGLGGSRLYASVFKDTTCIGSYRLK